MLEELVERKTRELRDDEEHFDHLGCRRTVEDHLLLGGHACPLGVRRPAGHAIEQLPIVVANRTRHLEHVWIVCSWIVLRKLVVPEHRDAVEVRLGLGTVRLGQADVLHVTAQGLDVGAHRTVGFAPIGAEILNGPIRGVVLCPCDSLDHEIRLLEFLDATTFQTMNRSDKEVVPRAVRVMRVERRESGTTAELSRHATGDFLLFRGQCPSS